MIDIFPISFSIALFFIFFEKFQNKRGIRNLRKSPQTLHKKSISRFGGVGLYASLVIVSFFDGSANYEFLRLALLCSMPIFFLGVLDDLALEIKPIIRLLVVFPSALLAYFFLGTEAYSLEIPIIDNLFKYEIFSILFICFAIAGMTNAFNMLDGVNGNVLLYSLTVCATTLFLQKPNFDLSLNHYFVAMFFSILGVFILNFPFGRIFLGDGGAYFLGIALSIGIIKYYQVNNLSSWYVFAVFIYPVVDVAFSIIRRMIARVSALEPDNKHLHHLIYRKATKAGVRSENFKHIICTIFIFIFYTPFLVAANYLSESTTALMAISGIFVLFYFCLYFVLIPKDFNLQ